MKSILFIMRRCALTALIALTLMVLLGSPARAQTSTFTYQGRLTDGMAAASGAFDFEFALYDASGNQIGDANTRDDVQVLNGVFTVQLDFGAAAFDGAPRTLGISVRRGAETGAYTALTPRQPITSTPYAIRAVSAETAASATNATQLGGTAASQFVQTEDARLSDARQPTAGSSNYIQNQNSAAQTSANFNIDGTGAANIFNAGLQYNIGGTRAFTITANNTIAGFGAGETATGTNNSFYGYLTGRATFGSANSFFGFSSGAATVSGGSNSFFGENSGLRNTSGRQNSFFGRGAGQTNVDGNNNTALGMNADVGTGALRFAAAIGSYASVSTNDTIVLGKAAGMFNGVQRPADAVQIPGSLVVSGSGTMGSLTVNGSGTGTTRIGGVFNSANYAGITLNNSTDPNHYNFLSSPNDQALYINRPSGNSIIFRKDNQTQMTLDTDGNLTVTGSISGATKNFKIDHPLDPANKTLTYTSIESPDMKNIYDGNITTNARGEATVTMPDYFPALNKDFRYQLTVIGTFAQAIVSDEINGNQFKIKTDKPNVKVSWQVTGIRRDPFAEDQRQPIEQEKPAASKGKCLYAPACQNKLEKK